MDDTTDHLRNLLDSAGSWLAKFEEWNQTRSQEGNFKGALVEGRRDLDQLREKANGGTLVPDMETRVLFHNLSGHLFLCFANFPEKYDEQDILSFHRYLAETQIVLLGL